MGVLGLSSQSSPARSDGLLSRGAGAPIRKATAPVRAWAIYSRQQLALGIKEKLLKSSEIKAVQKLLTDLGYYHGPINGIYDAKLRGAHEAYRRSFFQWIESEGTTEFAEAMTKMAEGEARAGVREEGGDNRGKRVEEYQRAVGEFVVGTSWCAAFVCWCIAQAANTGAEHDFELPREGMAFRFEDWAAELPGDGVYLLDPDRGKIRRGDIAIFNFSHIGICTGNPDGEGNFPTVEGNTTAGATDLAREREGGGVFARRRSLELVRSIVRFGPVLTTAPFRATRFDNIA